MVAAAPTAGAQANPFQRGPNPTNASIEATTGAFATSTTTVGRGNGFGGGTIYFPTSTAEGTFGAIAVAPGFTATQSSIAWLGPRIASQGFVVFTIDTNSRFDNPSARATQLQNALNYLINTSSVRTRIDASRLGVMGHSMGGGGTLEAARNNTNLQAAVPLMPWDQTKSFPGIRTPTLIIGSQNDGTASPANHAIPFFNSIPAASEKAYLELAGAGHTAANSPNTTLAKYAISWLKRYIDNDTRYEQFLCPAPSGSTISQYRDTCPGS
ncbi:MAG TPA: dienelactone hydrolase family protein [Acidimicrobiales bacterium]|nr:dienelactone hydrolase family protein [Acidimicrobiales bacterium]